MSIVELKHLKSLKIKKMTRIKISAALIIAAIIMPSMLKAQDVKYLQVVQGGKVKSHYDITQVDSVIFGTLPANVAVINGVAWAKYNVDAPGTFTTNIYDYGMFYQWNRPTGWSNSDPLVNHQGGTVWDNSTPTGTTWETSNNVCPTGFRVPTISELASLLDSESVWEQKGDVWGRTFGSGDNTLFMPASGYRNYSDGALLNQSSSGFYWSSSHYFSNLAHYLYFYSVNVRVNYYSRTFGFSVRCVSE